MKRILLCILLVWQMPLYAQFATFEPIVHTPKQGRVVPIPIVLPDLPELPKSSTNQSSSNDNISVLTSYRARIKFTENKEWTEWVYNNINIILDEDKKCLEFINNNKLKIYYDRLEYFEDSKNGGNIFVSNKAFDNKDNKVRLFIYIGRNTSYVNLQYSDIEYLYELKIQ